MKRIAQKLGWYIYHAVHANGVAADVVYWGAYYVQSLWRSVQYKRLSWRGVTPEELYEYRHLTPSSGLAMAVTSICNAKCSFCAYSKVVASKTLQTGIMPVDVFKKAVEEWATAGGQNLDLTPVVGDPLVDPGLLEKVDYAVNHARIKNVVLTTNGILLNRSDTYKRLIDLGIGGVFISTQGTSKEMYEKVYGVKQYDEVMSGIRNLLEYNHARGEPVHIVIRFRNAEKPSQIVRSQDFIENIRPYLSERVRINFTVDYDNWGGIIGPKDMIGFMRLRKLPPRPNIPCKNLFNLSVRHDGSVRLCGCRLVRTDLDDLVVGNVREQSLGEISRSERAWNIIKGFYSDKRPETCVGCTWYQPIDRRWLTRRARSYGSPTAI